MAAITWSFVLRWEDVVVQQMQCSKPPVAPRAVSPSPLSQQQQQQQYLQARIKQLTADNDALRRKQLLSRNNLSVPDLSALSPTQVHATISSRLS